MRKIKIDNDLIEKIKETLEEVDANERSTPPISFAQYWYEVTSTTEEMVEAILTEPNYYEPNSDDVLEDFYEIKTMKYNKIDNTIDFEINEQAKIFLKRLYYGGNDIRRIIQKSILLERKDKLKTLKLKV